MWQPGARLLDVKRLEGCQEAPAAVTRITSAQPGHVILDFVEKAGGEYESKVP
jgi:hypothetical protein